MDGSELISIEHRHVPEFEDRTGCRLKARERRALTEIFKGSLRRELRKTKKASEKANETLSPYAAQKIFESQKCPTHDIPFVTEENGWTLYCPICDKIYSAFSNPQKF